MDDAFPSHPSRSPNRAPRRVAWVLLAATWPVAVGGCSPYIGTTAASFLRRVRDEPDPNVRYVAYTKLASPNCYDSPEQKAEAIKILLTKLGEGKEPVASRAVIINTLGKLGAKASRPMMVRLASDPEPVLRVQACRALGRVGEPEDATVLARVMAIDQLEDCKIAAIEALGELKADDPRIKSMLIAGMRNDDPATRLASVQSLRKITGKDYGTDAVAWQKVLPQQEDARVAQASTAPAPAPATPPIEPAYPPRPNPIRTVVDSQIEMAGGKTRAQMMKEHPEEQGASFVSPIPTTPTAPPPSNTYPATNPNFAPSPR